MFRRLTGVPAILAGGIFASACGWLPGSPPTYTEDVASVLFENCAGCHRPNQGTPFSLLTYDDAASRASRLARAVGSGHMPPWLPDPASPAFVGERRLDARSIDIIQRWASGGALEGPAAARPPQPSFPDGWLLGAPDLVVSPSAAYPLQAGGVDVFRNMVIAVPLDRPRFVRAVEFDTGGAPVHHSVVHIDRTTASRRLDGADGAPGFDGMGARDAQDPPGHFLGWAPGRGPITAPDGMPWRLDPGMDLVLELHLVPGEHAIDVQPRVALHFSDDAPRQVPVMFKMGSKSLDIPAGVADYTVEDRFTLPVDVDLLSLYPHAHYLGRDMRVTAALPDGSTRELLRIRRWSFRWQQDYRYTEPVALPRGTTLVMRFTYDNSKGNPDNPRREPVRVICGPASTDEMANLGIQVVASSAADRRALSAATRAHDARVNLDGAEMLVRYDPFDAANRTFLAGSLVDAGRPADALPHLEVALGLEPQSARAHNELGGAYAALGRGGEALAAFERAASLAPEDDRMHFNVGIMLARLGRTADAARAFERALALNPGHADAHGELGVLRFGAGQHDQAMTHLRQAVTLNPDEPRLLSDLGGILASLGRYDEARATLERAVALAPDYEPARQNLARLSSLGTGR